MERTHTIAFIQQTTRNFSSIKQELTDKLAQLKAMIFSGQPDY